MAEAERRGRAGIGREKEIEIFDAFSLPLSLCRPPGLRRRRSLCCCPTKPQTPNARTLARPTALCPPILQDMPTPTPSLRPKQSGRETPQVCQAFAALQVYNSMFFARASARPRVARKQLVSHFSRRFPRSLDSPPPPCRVSRQAADLVVLVRLKQRERVNKSPQEAWQEIRTAYLLRTDDATTKQERGDKLRLPTE